MNIKVMTKEGMDEEISSRILSLIHSNPSIRLGLATGSSPIGVYDKLIQAYEEGRVSFRNVHSWNLDEYVGLDGNNPQSYRYFMNEHLFDHVDIDKANTHVPGGVGDYEEMAKRYDPAIEEDGGIDFQILGIGSDGHIAFNEPGTPLDSLTHVAELAESTIRDNARFFASIDEVPTKAVSMGLGSIMRAKEIVLIATGKNKANAIRALIQGDVCVEFPCTVLKNHPNVTIYVDEAAYSLVR